MISERDIASGGNDMITYSDIYEAAENNLSGFFLFSLLVPVKRSLLVPLRDTATLLQEGMI
jgi:hypothetical protein